MSISIVSLMIIIGIAALLLTAVMVYGFKIKKSILMSYVQNFAGILFIFSGWVKAVDPMGTAFKMEDYFNEFYATFQGTAFNFLAPIFPTLVNFSLVFAIVMIIFEIVLGVMLIMGDRPKLTSWLFFLLVVFFTALTGFTFLTGYVPMDANFFNFGAWTEYKASNMRVTDCGCFGDFIKLEPRISFYKDLFLLIPAFYFIWRWKDMHQLMNSGKRTFIIGVLMIALLLYCVYNFFWNEPHVDFRPFKNGTNVAAIYNKEKASMAEVKVTAMKMKHRTNGTIKTFSYEEYMKNLSVIMEDYETIEQIKSEPSIKPTKISDFSVYDFNDEEQIDYYLFDGNTFLSIPIYKAKYSVERKNVTLPDTIYRLDTIMVEGFKDSVTTVRNIDKIATVDKEINVYTWDKSLVKVLNQKIKPLVESAQKDKIPAVVLVSGLDKEKVASLAAAADLDITFHIADEKFIKTIMRSNPGIILWNKGVLLQKWHHKKVPSWDEIKSTYLK